MDILDLRLPRKIDKVKICSMINDGYSDKGIYDYFMMSKSYYFKIKKELKLQGKLKEYV